MMSDLVPTDIYFDPCDLSKSWLIALMFLQSSSSKYKEAVSIAGSLSFFHQSIIEGRQINFVGVGKTRKDISKFLTLQALIWNWKGSKFFAGGRPLLNPYSLNQTLDCYLLSLSCTNFQAHCWQIIDHPFFRQDPFSEEDGLSLVLTIKPKDDFANPKKKKVDPPPLLLNPCKRLSLYYLSKHHPANIKDQVQALAVENNVDWCPNFKVDEIKRIDR